MTEFRDEKDLAKVLPRLQAIQAELQTRHLSLGRELADLGRQIAQARNELIHASRSSTHRDVPASLDDGELDAAARGGRPVRAVVLDLLHDLEVPTYSRLLSQLAQAIYGREVQAVRFGSLGTDERRAYTMRPNGRSVWLGSALTHHRFEPIRRLWIRSDWPLEKRVIAPLSSRVNHLRTTARLCQWALDHQQVAEADMLRIIAADHARDVEGITVKRGIFELAQWREAALSALGRYEALDAEQRHEAAGRLADCTEVVQLFGRPDVIEGPRMRVIADLREDAR